MITQYLQKTDVPVSAPKRGGTVAYPQQDPFAKTESNSAMLRRGGAGQPQTPVQRQVVRGADVEENTINLTSVVTAFTDYGTTYVQLNGAELPGNGAFVNAVAPPEFNVAAGDNDYVARVTGEPVNTVSSRVALPTAPAWETGIALSNLSARLNMMRGRPITDANFIGNKPDREILLYVKGLPSDATFANLVRQHELHHVADINTAIGQALTPWDLAIRNAIAQNTEYHGDSVETAEAAMWAGLGGTTAQVGVALRGALQALGNGFHAQPLGARPPLNRVEGEKRFLLRDIVRVYFDHPMAG